ncbi:Stp1/IreP family PP2C-type Ser/Thr phosphatase [Virgibacillus xinjiangensis]|uniref:Stp1/IreP family PP2C-type Ser/Thr phosphatase n=1 Tax=Virgibacillus xinjiangensis TaxID=393090 RepID=A0ABV7CVE2_9BACI
MKGTFLTNTGRVRSHNEDAGGIFHNAAGQCLAVIADGMGGHKAGDVASRMATSLLEKKWAESSLFTKPDQTEEWVAQAVEEINQAIFTKSQENKECQGMGTTIVITIFVDDFVTIAHIGDSRCYRIQDGTFKQVTEDHSLVNALVQSGQISKEEAQHHPRKNVVLKALGTESDVSADIKTLSLESGSIYFLCTDGLTDKVMDEEIADSFLSRDDLTDIGERLINVANDRGGEDNISLIILHHDNASKAGDG